MYLKKGQLLFGLGFVYLGVFLFYNISYPIINQSFNSKYWLSTNASIIQSHVNSNAGEGRDLYRIGFKAEYEVNRETYTFSKRYLDNEAATSWKGAKYEFVNNHPVGSIIEVFYNPHKPFDVKIEYGFRPSYLLTPGFSIIFFLLGFWTVYRSF